MGWLFVITRTSTLFYANPPDISLEHFNGGLAFCDYPNLNLVLRQPTLLLFEKMKIGRIEPDFEPRTTAPLP